MMNAHMWSRRSPATMASAWARPQGVWRAAMIVCPPPLCSTRPPRIQGTPASLAAVRAASSCTMASSWTWVTERPFWGCRLSAGKWPTTIVWKCTMRWRPRAACSRPERRSRRGVSIAPPATTTRFASMVCSAPVGVDVLDARRPAAVGEDPAHVRLGHQLRPPGRHRFREQRHGVALGVDRAAEERAEPAVVAGGPPVVGDAVRRGRCLVGVQADLLGRFRRERCAVHGRAGRHRIGARAPRRERVRAGAAGHTHGTLDLGVVGLELVVVERPVLHMRVRVGLRPEQRVGAEVLLPKARHLAVGVRAAAAHGRRDGVHLAHMGVLALVRVAPERPRLGQRVGAEEVARRELDLVVGVVAGRLREVVGVEQVVAALLHDHDGPAGPRQHLGHGGAARTRADDDGVRASLTVPTPPRRCSPAAARRPPHRCTTTRCRCGCRRTRVRRTCPRSSAPTAARRNSSSVRSAPSLLLAVGLGEIGAQCGQTVAVPLLEPDDRTVELALGQCPATPRCASARPARRAADSGTKSPKPRLAAMPTRGRPSRPDAGRVEGERAEERVDEVGDARLVGPGPAESRGHHLLARGLQGRVLLLAQPDGHRANVAWGPAPLLTLLSGSTSGCQGDALAAARRWTTRSRRATCAARPLSSSASATRLPVCAAPNSASRVAFVEHPEARAVIVTSRRAHRHDGETQAPGNKGARHLRHRRVVADDVVVATGDDVHDVLQGLRPWLEVAGSARAPRHGRVRSCAAAFPRRWARTAPCRRCRARRWRRPGPAPRRSGTAPCAAGAGRRPSCPGCRRPRRRCSAGRSRPTRRRSRRSRSCGRRW